MYLFKIFNDTPPKGHDVSAALNTGMHGVGLDDHYGSLQILDTL